MSQIRFNFLNWRPDMEDTEHDGLSIAQNVLHDTEGYKPSRTMSTAGAITTIVTKCFSDGCYTVPRWFKWRY